MNDFVVPAEQVTSFWSDIAKKNDRVQLVAFEKEANHMQNLTKYPALYRQHIEQFLI